MFLLFFQCLSEDAPSFRVIGQFDCYIPFQNYKANIEITDNIINNNITTSTILNPRIRTYHSCSIIAKNCSFEKCYCSGPRHKVNHGGAIYAAKSSFYSKNVSYTSCIAKFGGALCLENCISLINGDNNICFLNNIAYGSGGAIYLDDNNSMSWITIQSLKFMNNTAISLGGAIFSFNIISFLAINCNFENNSAGQSGGAIYSNAIENFEIFYSKFHSNIVNNTERKYYNITNTTITTNTTNTYSFKTDPKFRYATRGGGAFALSDISTVVTQGCCFSNNTVNISQMSPLNENHGLPCDVLLNGVVNWDSLFDTFASFGGLDMNKAFAVNKWFDNKTEINVNFIEAINLLFSHFKTDQHYSGCLVNSSSYSSESPEEIPFSGAIKSSIKYNGPDPSPTSLTTPLTPLTRIPFATTRSKILRPTSMYISELSDTPKPSTYTPRKSKVPIPTVIPVPSAAPTKAGVELSESVVFSKVSVVVSSYTHSLFISSSVSMSFYTNINETDHWVSTLYTSYTWGLIPTLVYSESSFSYLTYFEEHPPEIISPGLLIGLLSAGATLIFLIIALLIYFLRKMQNEETPSMGEEEDDDGAKQMEDLDEINEYKLDSIERPDNAEADDDWLQ